ncbi:PAS domain-containing hybrid sensor histidine kinase/response regulator [Desulforhopalus sp. 52FAK]
MKKKILSADDDKLTMDSETFRSMFKEHSAVMYIVDLSTFAIIDANQAALDFYGYDLDTMLTKRVPDLNITPELEIRAEIKRALDENRSYYVYKHQLANGEIRDVEVYANPISVKGQEYSFSVVHDITARKNIEDALQDSQERFKALSNATFEAIFISENGICLDLNRTAEQMFGYSPDEARGRYATDFIVSEDRERVKSNIHSCSEKPYEVTALRKDGSTFPSEIQGRMTTLKGADVRITALRDISESKRTEKALKENEEKYRTLFDMESDALAVIEIKTGKMLEVNNAFIELYGYSRDEVIKMKNTDFSAEPQKTRSATQTRGTYIPVRYHRKKDGTVFPTEISASIFNYQGRDVHIAAIRDITERQRLEAQIQRSQKMESMGLLAGGVAHDLNNILSGIVSYPELILMDLPEDSSLRKPIKTMQAAGNRAAAIVEDLLTIARGVATTKEILNINALVNDYLESPEFEKLIQFHPAVKVRTDLDANLLNTIGSHSHLRKVVMNLVSNAAEAIEGGGTVTLSTHNIFVDKPLKGYEDVNIDEYAVLKVADDGRGIPSNEIERIFEPFYTKKIMGRSGTGLGLAVVWNVMQDHEGYIDVSSESCGTTFQLFFPVSREDIIESSSSIAFESYMGHGETILVIDDVAAQREIACNFLEKLGYVATEVSSGEAAVKYLMNHTVDLLLLDMIMEPGISGLETYDQILRNHPGQKAVIVSGFSETDAIKEAQRLGAGKFVKKPYTFEKIGLAIHRELSRPRSSSI